MGTTSNHASLSSHQSKNKLKRCDSGASIGGRALTETTPNQQTVSRHSEKDKTKRKEVTKDTRKAPVTSSKSVTSGRSVTSSKSRETFDASSSKSRKKTISRTLPAVKAGCVVSGSGTKSSKPLNETDDSVIPSFSRVSSLGPSSKSDRPASRSSNSGDSTSSHTVTRKLKRKRSPEDRRLHVGQATVRKVGSSQVHLDHAKSRPEDLLLCSSQDVESSGNDAPDTGDVQHMLEELLHPPPLSLVTPIATPKNGTPFVFPSTALQTQKQLAGEVKVRLSLAISVYLLVCLLSLSLDEMQFYIYN